MTAFSTDSLRLSRPQLLVSLLVLTIAAWVLLVWQATHMDAMMAITPTMGMDAPIWLAVWVAMMVAVMFPSAAPMFLVFARADADRRARQEPFVPVWVFAGAYLLVWAVMGVAAYGAAVEAERLAGQSMWIMDNAGRIGGALLLAAGLYQLSPLKNVCLAQCRSARAFVTSSWHDGYTGACRMGLRHGLYCLGCNWLLFVILFPLGMLNIAALAAITVLIFVEKVLPIGQRASRLAAVALIAYGLIALVAPDVLPSMQVHGQMSM